MRNINSIAITLLAASVLAFSGCGSKDYSTAPVTGTVTFNGEPVSEVKVLFMPASVEGNDEVGPYSSGKTDAAGKFTLKTRYDDEGAVIGQHNVTFQFTDIPEGTMVDLRDKLANAKDDGDQQKYQQMQQKIKEVEAKLKGRPDLRASKQTVDVPTGGTDSMTIELGGK